MDFSRRDPVAPTRSRSIQWRGYGFRPPPLLFYLHVPSLVQARRAVAVRWPARQRLREEAVTVIGYTGSVILPLTIVPQDRAKPVMLRLKLDYAVCEKLCIPAEGKAELMLGGGPSSQDAAL